MIYKKVAIFGTGLIGGSIGMELKKKKLSNEVCGWGRNMEHLNAALKTGACDSITLDIQEALKGSEIVILATSIHHIKKLLPLLSKDAPDALLMDVGSVKAGIVQAAEEAKIINFVPCHPMAGSEKTGIHNASCGLFQNAPCIITPLEINTQEIIKKTEVFWKQLGSRVIILSPQEHDRLVAFISHLPHIISSSLITSCFEKIKDTVGSGHPTQIAEIAGPSFSEITRIAGSSGSMWSEIYYENKENVLKAIEAFEKTLEKFKQLLLEVTEDNQSDGSGHSTLEKFLQEGADYRKKYVTTQEPGARIQKSE